MQLPLLHAPHSQRPSKTLKNVIRLYFHNDITDTSWHKFPGRHEYPTETLKHRRRWDSGSILNCSSLQRQGVRESRTASGVLWQIELSRHHIVCWKYFKNRQEEEQALKYFCDTRTDAKHIFHATIR